ncbi:MAG: hypothetical protein Q8J76_09635 [Desulfobulbaceae bacterium]|nr:hypothetical protein [Desulfobulbaceae bacterium]
MRDKITDQKKSIAEEVETHLARAAFAEESEPCPLDTKEEIGANDTGVPTQKDDGESLMQSLDNDLPFAGIRANKRA